MELKQQMCCSTCTYPCASCVCLWVSALRAFTSMSLWLKHMTKLLLPCHMQPAYLPLLHTFLINSFPGDINRITCLMLYGLSVRLSQPPFAPQVVHGWALMLAALWHGRIQQTAGRPWSPQCWNSLAG